MSPRHQFDLLAFQAVWWICAIGGSYGTSVPGGCAAAAFIAHRLTREIDRRTLIACITIAGIVGLSVEIPLMIGGWVLYPSFVGIRAPPLWMIALWLAFGASLQATAALLSKWPRIVLGVLSAPLAYVGGDRLGALELATPKLQSFAPLLAIWTVVLPCLLWMAARLDIDHTRAKITRLPRSTGTPGESSDSS